MWVDITFTICVTILCILCFGNPDLLDTIIGYVQRLKVCP